MGPQLLANSYKFDGHEGSKGAIFHGAFYIDADGIYLIHNNHGWESAGTAAAAFGLLGAMIHHFMTRKKQAVFPYKETALSSLDSDIVQAFDIKKFQDSATLAIIPKSEVGGFKTGAFAGTKFQIGSFELIPISPKGAVVKQLEELEYNVLGK